MLNVVEEEPRNGEHCQVIDARRFLGDLASESRVLALECPRDKGREFAAAASFIDAGERFIL